VVQRHPGVADVTAVGVADAVVNGNGHLAKAVVVLKAGYDDVTGDDLLIYANRKLSLYHSTQNSATDVPRVGQKTGATLIF